jgi:hypothetical protein
LSFRNLNNITKAKAKIMTQSLTLKSPDSFAVQAQSQIQLVEQKDESNKTNSSKVTSCGGRCVRFVEKAVNCTLHGITALVQKVFYGLSALAGDSNALAAFFRKLDKHVLRMMEHVGNLPGYFNRFGAAIRSAVAVIDFAQVAADIDYFINGKFKQDNKINIAGRVAACVADVGGALLWLEEMSFYSLSKAAAAIGNVRIFSFVPKVVSIIPGVRNCTRLQSVAATVGNLRVFSFITKISLGFVAERALTLAYAFFAIESFKRLIEPGTGIQKVQASLDLASYSAELALDALLTVGVASTVVLGIAGATCLTLALASFLHKVSHEKELKKATVVPEQEVQIVAT